MSAICLYFQVHQPFRVKRYSIFQVGKDSNYFSDDEDEKLSNRKILKKVSNKCYLPTNKLLLELIKKYPKFKIKVPAGVSC